jgi:hypothetical protein
VLARPESRACAACEGKKNLTEIRRDARKTRRCSNVVYGPSITRLISEHELQESRFRERRMLVALRSCQLAVKLEPSPARLAFIMPLAPSCVAASVKNSHRGTREIEEFTEQARQDLALRVQAGFKRFAQARILAFRANQNPSTSHEHQGSGT